MSVTWLDMSVTWLDISLTWLNMVTPLCDLVGHDLPSVIRRTADFLNKRLSDNQVDSLAQHLSFDSMKKNRSVNYEEVVEINRRFNLIPAEGDFMRAGQVGGWKGKMTEQQVEQFDQWTEEHLEGTGLCF
uniref:Sulfotransferase domain-containing protein n=1 Tax=Timema monikensis TaxID=170555 RepID=A0A7R9ELH6_9NEOP|nr:unnamed protein product [Timema monikensis]